jgi:Holliday junction resolvase RusA-like endonuclease
MIIPSQVYKKYESDCLKQITGQHKHQFIGRLNLCCKYWVESHRSADILNLLAATSDILEKAGVVENDRYFVRVDGSEIAGVDKHNPRVEITITRLAGEDKGVQQKLIS